MGLFVQTGAGEELTVEEGGVGGGGSGGAGRRRLLVPDAAGIEGVVVPLLAHVAVGAARVPEVLQEPRARKGFNVLLGRVNSEESFPSKKKIRGKQDGLPAC